MCNILAPNTTKLTTIRIYFHLCSSKHPFFTAHILKSRPFGPLILHRMFCSGMIIPWTVDYGMTCHKNNFANAAKFVKMCVPRQRYTRWYRQLIFLQLNLWGFHRLTSYKEEKFYSGCMLFEMRIKSSRTQNHQWKAGSIHPVRCRHEYCQLKDAMLYHKSIRSALGWNLHFRLHLLQLVDVVHLQ